ncbi:MAG: two-component regulator propeller domain-containing protein [Bacteroidota bacterium]
MAQKYNIKTFTVNDGLPSNQVFDIEFDRYGYVWFGTADGLARYNGKEYKVFGLAEGLRDEFVNDIFFDSDERLWLATAGRGLALLENDGFTYKHRFSVLDEFEILQVRLLDRDTYVFSTFGDGLLIWENEALIQLTVKDGLPSNDVYGTLLVDELLFINTVNGLARYNLETKELDELRPEAGVRYIFSGFVTQDEEIWFGTEFGIEVYTSDGRFLKAIRELGGIELESVFTVSQDRWGAMWIGTREKGVIIQDKGKTLHLTKRNGLQGNYVTELEMDPKGNIWIGTDGTGLAVLKDIVFRIYDNATISGFENVYGIYQDSKQRIWIGSDGVLYRKDGEGEFTPFRIPDSISFQDEIWDIEELPNGNILLLTGSFRLIEFNGRSFFNSDRFREIADTAYINRMLIDHNDRVWLGTHNGLIALDGESARTFRLSNTFVGNIVVSLFEDSKGTIWVGTESGISKIEGDSVRTFTPDNGLLGYSVLDMTEDQFGNIWVGTNLGISIFENGDLDNEPINVERDIPFRKETMFLEDDGSGGIWQGTNSGLNYFDIRDFPRDGGLKPIHFSFSELGSGLEFSGNASLFANNEVLMGSIGRGLVEATISSATLERIERSAPEVFLRSIVANREPLDGIGDQKVRLNANQNNLTFHFDHDDFVFTNRIKFRYRLMGEETWQSAFDISEVSYTDLDPGRYQFQIQAKSTRSEYGPITSSVTYVVPKPFQQTVWYYLLIIGLVVVATFIGYRVRFTQMKKKELQKLVDERTHYLQVALEEKEILVKEIHHRVKNNLAVVSSLLELRAMDSKGASFEELVKESQSRIKSIGLIHELLYQNKNLSRINFKDYLGQLLPSLEEAANFFDKEIALITELDSFDLPITQAVPLGLIVNESVTNAYEHAFVGRDSGCIKLIAKVDNDRVTVVIKDDGIGNSSQENDEHEQSMGLTLVNMLAQQLCADYERSSDNGTTMTISFALDFSDVERLP